MFRLAAVSLSLSSHPSWAGMIRSGGGGILPLEQRRVQEEGCFGSELVVKPKCDLDSILSAMQESGGCDGTESELAEYFGVGKDEVAGEVEKMCVTALDAWHEKDVPFKHILHEGVTTDHEFFCGGTDLNEQVQTRKLTDGYGGGFDTQILEMDAFRFNRIQNDDSLGATNHGIEWPDYIPNFESCEHRAAMCCWVQDRQDDDNGNCRERGGLQSPVDYDTFCDDKDPADNTDVCVVDMEKADFCNHVAGGFAVFEEEEEGPVHCHGLAWPEDDADARSRYKGNNLFYISMYDHLYQRGYIRNVPGAPMCSCVAEMPLVERSDCTQMDIVETFLLQFNNGSRNGILEASLTDVRIRFNSCRGRDANGNPDNNDLESYYRVLYGEDSEELKALQQYIVGDGNCPSAIKSFLDSQGLMYIAPTIETDQLEYKYGEEIVISWANHRNANENDKIAILFESGEQVEDIYTCGYDSKFSVECKAALQDGAPTEGTVSYVDGSKWMGSFHDDTMILEPGKYRVVLKEKGYIETAKSPIFTVLPSRGKVWTDEHIYYEGEVVTVHFEDHGIFADNWIGLYNADTTFDDDEEQPVYDGRLAAINPNCNSYTCPEGTAVVKSGSIPIPAAGWMGMDEPDKSLAEYPQAGECYKFYLREKASWTGSWIWDESDVFCVLPASFKKAESGAEKIGVVSFDLYNAETNQLLVEGIEDGAEYSIDDMEAAYLAIVAVTNPPVVEKVVVSSDHWFEHGHTLSYKPYALFGDSYGNLKGRTFEADETYKVSAAAFDSIEVAIGAPLEIAFTIVA